MSLLIRRATLYAAPLATTNSTQKREDKRNPAQTAESPLPLPAAGAIRPSFWVSTRMAMSASVLWGVGGTAGTVALVDYLG